MGIFDNWHDPMNLNGTDRSVKVKAYLPDNYDGFGCGYEEHKRYLPCMAILERLSGDSFYQFSLLTEDGPVRSCGYGYFHSASEITRKLTKRIWHYQAFDPIEKVENMSQPVVLVRNDECLMPTGNLEVFDSVDKAIGVVGNLDCWVLIADLLFDI